MTTGPDGPVAEPSWGRRLRGIEGLRGIAAMSVAIAHAAILLKGDIDLSAGIGLLVGLMLHGLTLFFVLSGFLLYRPFAAAIVSGSSLPSTRAFYRNRILRIWPAYLVIFAISSFVLGTSVISAAPEGPNTDVTAERVGYLTDPVLILANLALVQGWFPSGVLTGLGTSWSLVPEVSFYLVLPLLAWLGWRNRRRFSGVVSAVVPCIVLLVIGFTGRMIVGALIASGPAETLSYRQSGETWTAVLHRSIFALGDLFAVGMLAAVAVVVIGRHGARRSRTAPARRVAWLAFVISSCAVLASGGEDRVATPAMGALCGSVIALLLLPGAGRFLTGVANILESRPLRALGLWSYSIYLWHFPAIWLLRLHTDWAVYTSPTGLLLSILAMLVITLPLSWVTYRLVEAPAMQRKVAITRSSART